MGRQESSHQFFWPTAQTAASPCHVWAEQMPCKHTQLVGEHRFITSQHLPELNPSLLIPCHGWKTRYFSSRGQSQGVLRTNVQTRLLEAIHWKCEAPVAFLTWVHYSQVCCCVYSGALPFHPPLIYLHVKPPIAWSKTGNFCSVYIKPWWCRH